MSSISEKRTNTETNKISWREKISYGVGDLACSMVFNFMQSYLFYFYTDVAGIAVAAVGTILSTARLVDAFANPVVGVLSDKTNTRWGKLRPYLLFSAIPLAISTVLIFLVTGVDDSKKMVYALVTYMAFCLLYTICNVPYTALMPNITESKKERSHLNMTKFISVSVGSLISMGLAMPLVALLGKGDDGKGFIYLSIIFAVIIVVLILVSFFGTKERIVSESPKFSLKLFLSTAKKSRPWIILCVGQMFMYFATNAKITSTIYYAKYYLNNSGFASLLLSVGAFTILFGALVMPKLVQKFSKRAITHFGQILFILSCVFTYFSGENLVLIFIFNLMGTLGTSIASGVSFLILGETIDHSEYVTGVRQQGLFTSVMMFMIKMGIVISSAVSAAVLSYGGYVADVQQSAESLSAIKFNYIFIPIIAGAVSFIIFILYNLDKNYGEINKELQKRRETQSKISE